MAQASSKRYIIYHFREADMQSSDRHRIEVTSDNASGRDTEGSTLLPMLIAGLILIVAGATVIVLFV